MPVSIHGKEYVMVNERVKAFHSDHKNGSIITELVSMTDGICIVKSTVYPDISNPERKFTGHAYEKEGSTQINRTSYLENCETSAIGRALASAGYGIDASFASANEVQQAQSQQTSGSRVVAKAVIDNTKKVQYLAKRFEELAKKAEFTGDIAQARLDFCASCVGIEHGTLISSKMLDDKQIDSIATILAKTPKTVDNFLKSYKGDL